MGLFDTEYYTELELRNAGFKTVGENVQIAKNCTIVGESNIDIGDNVRIDSYTSIIAIGDGFVELGSYIHIGSHSYLGASRGIIFKDFTGLSQGVKIYSQSDDYSGEHMTNPTVPSEYTGGTQGTVTLEKHVIIGSNTVILPCLKIGEGSAVGAQSLVVKSLDEWGLYVGVPVKKIKDRTKTLLEKQALLLHRY
ncbi:MAG: acetyltransferase-like isoleucine patch superfamily enzyme [Candidatus Azotimanducaceae bacterium]|jgi:acetyltransferase-like isoleucine patch superfamily enzyme